MRATTFLALLAGSAAAFPMADNSPVLVTRGGKIVTARTAIEAIMPKSVSCEEATNKTECRTAKEAAPFLIKAMTGFSLGQIAAMLALVGVESVDMQYKHNVYPGRPGQGTSNMMMVEFTTEYAISIFGKDAVANKEPNEILAMVTPDEHNFASAPWFLRTQCTKEVQDKLLGGTDEGFEAYMGCIHVNASAPERQEYWQRAKLVFGLD